MKFSFIAIFCFVFIGVSAQKIHKIAADSTLIVSQWDGSWDEMQMLYAKLPKLEVSPYKYHFRYSESNQIADIYSNDTVSFNGRVLINLVMINENTTIPRKNFTDHYVYRYTEIDPAAATKIGRFIIRERLNEVPNMYDDWGDWCDMRIGCNSIGLHYKMDTVITRKGYHCPQGQSSLSDNVTKIKKLQKDLRSLLEWEKQFTDFNNDLDNDREYHNGWDSWYIPSKQEKKEWDKNKQARKWLTPYDKEINNRLENYITLSKGNIPPEGAYTLYFSKEGNLEKIKNGAILHEPYSPLKKESGKQIENLFKNIDLKDMKLEYGFIKVLEVYRPDSYRIENLKKFWLWKN